MNHWYTHFDLSNDIFQVSTNEAHLEDKDLRIIFKFSIKVRFVVTFTVTYFSRSPWRQQVNRKICDNFFHPGFASQDDSEKRYENKAGLHNFILQTTFLCIQFVSFKSFMSITRCVVTRCLLIGQLQLHKYE
jgi:hypothetical protein